MQIFDEERYLIENPDVARAVAAGLFASGEAHYLAFGETEGRTPRFRTLRPSEGPGRRRDGKGAIEPLVSVVMPAFNEERFVEEAIRSILAQTEPRFELLVVDDGSTDRTADIVRSLEATDPRVRLIQQRNGGTGSALNNGFRHARGLFQTWFSADNIMFPHALEELVKALERDRSAVLAYGDFITYDWETAAETVERPTDFSKAVLRRYCYLGNTWLFRREVKAAVGEYSLAMCEDYDMHLRMAELGRFAHVSRVLGVWRGHAGNLTTTQCAPAGWRPAILVQARHQWRTAPHRVLHVTPPGHQVRSGWYLMQAVAQLSERFGMRLLGSPGADSSFNDLVLGGRDPIDGDSARFIEDASVIHLNLDARVVNSGAFDPKPWVKLSRPLVVHLHGTLTSNSIKMLQTLRYTTNARLVTSRADQEESLDAPWLPELLPIDSESGFMDMVLLTPSRGWPHPDRPRFIYDALGAPRAECEAVQRVFREIAFQAGAAEGPSFINAAERPLPYRKHLERKRSAAILIDSVHRGELGRSAWEALAQGVVVLSACNEAATRTYQRRWGSLPPIEHYRSAVELGSAIRRIIRDDGWRAERAALCRGWAVTHLHARKVLAAYEALYEGALTEGRLEDYAISLRDYCGDALRL